MKHIITHPFNMNKAIAVGIFLAFAIVVLNGCDAQAKSEPHKHNVEITDFLFVPETVNARPGDTITWTNRDIVPHTATGEGDSWDTGSINRNESKSLVVTADMVSGYICRFHPTMKGAVDVAQD